MRAPVLYPLLGFAVSAILTCAGETGETSRVSEETEPSRAADRPVVEVPASWAATLPCADCPGIEWTLTLLDDGTYRLRRVYLEAEAGEDRTVVDLGRWESETAAGRVVLLGGDDAPIHLEVVGTDTLRLLDQQGQPIESNFDYGLGRLAEVDLGEEADEPQLAGTHWRLTELPAEEGFTVDPELQAHLVLDEAEGRVSGSSGCNRVTGTFTRDGDALTLGPLAGTRMACPEPAMDQEGRFHVALERVVSWRIEDRTLDLLDVEGRPVARFEAGEMP